MSASVTPSSSSNVPWWKEPTKDQWYAYIAAWLGWTLDAFDFTIFLLIMVPIAKEFDVPLTAVAIVFTLTLWLRLVGATAAGWMADRMGRKTPLMISILWYSLCNFIAGFSPTFTFLLFFRALLGIGMGAEWPAGAALAMESWPARSRGFMSGVLQGSWGLGFALSALAYGLLYEDIGWRGLLWIGILPALVVVWIRFYVKEPEVWAENKRQQTETKAEVKLPLLHHLQAPASLQHADRLPVDGRGVLRLLLDLGAVLDLPAEGAELDAAAWWRPAVLGQHRGVRRLRHVGRGRRQMGQAARDHRALHHRRLRDAALSVDDRSSLDRRSASSCRACSAARSTARTRAISASASRPRCAPRPRASSITRARSGAAWWRRSSAYFAVEQQMGFAMPMMVSTIVFLLIVILAVALGPETKGKILTADLETIKAAEAP